ncbi:cyclic nucleotide-binding protein [Thiomicrorhabdus immobilis]|uniref:Cyclic nucleotide-binding protein n=1 Tax=Thiomicrorhabdus immobilis TaxID=2791037 RepID=A0ABM7MD53_9GAMM|nr:DUF294 nucleotidyltransferase-like domain-containing protein [Thiomicrorhabdus immobilis]BCN93282.1 cyclic nucleotide-binding protein [Thiomicrorhabdus immobilis]
MAIEQQLEFLSQITPFNLLDDMALKSAASSLDVIYFPENQNVSLGQKGANKIEYLFFVIKGRVAEKKNQEVVARYSVRSYFGDAELIAKQSASSSALESGSEYHTLEESILYRMPAEVFNELYDHNPQFANHFSASLVDKLNRIHESIQNASSTEVMMDTVCSAPLKPFVAVNENVSLQTVIQKMVEAKSDACVVEFEESEIGIITSTDIMKLLASGEWEQLKECFSLSEVVNRPVQTVHEFDYLFNALLKMTRYQIDRLVVRSENGYVGFLHQKDLMGLFANQSGLVLLKVEQAEDVESLAVVASQVDELIKNLNRKGIKTHYIAKLVNELHRKMIHKLVEILLPIHLHPKLCLFVMGSEGRAEQVVRTDQDNALIMSDDLSVADQTLVAEFAENFTQAMLQIGFPLCPGDIMLSNPDWRKTPEGFKATLLNWFNAPSEQSFMNIAILYDAEPVFGEAEWLGHLKAKLLYKVNEQPFFLRKFAVPAVQFKTPVGFFGGLKTESKSGSEYIDIKKGGIFPIVHGVRCYALEANLTQNNTHWRIKALIDKGVFTKEFGVELGETLNFLNTLRLESMLAQMALDDAIPSNLVLVSGLSHLQQDVLKQALHVVDGFKKKLSHHFKVNEVL